jgi:Zn-dependent protease with chaperone function/uncharacterized tellurite resistance protein B-like protein
MAGQTSDFFQRQDNARRRTHWLILLFVLAVFCIIAVLHFCAVLMFEMPWDDLATLGWVTIGVLGVVGLGTLYKISVLSSGGSAVAEMLGGKPVDLNSTDLKIRQLINVVEEMAIASGVPVPAIFVLEEEKGINAFAAGHAVGDAAVGVTRGCIDRLSRDELQGVIAHEFSHILNGDMRLNIRLMGVLFGILCLAVIGRVLLRAGADLSRGRSRNKNSGGFAAMLFGGGLALLVVGMIGVFFARLIQAAVSRQREYLADAAAVQFTRNPSGIGSALFKIGYGGGRLENPHTSEASHMFFASSISSYWAGLFATHPPVKQRLEAILPGFRPEMLETKKPPPQVESENNFSDSTSGGSTRSTPPPLPIPVNPQEWLGKVGTLNPAGIATAAAILASIPDEMHRAAHELQGACALIYSFLLSSDPSVRDRQLETVPLEETEKKETLRLFEMRGSLAADEEITLVELSLSALRGLSREQYRQFVNNLDTLIASDGQVHLYEFLIQTMVKRHLESYFNPISKPFIRHTRLSEILPDVTLLLFTLSQVGENEAEVREASYRRGLISLGEEAEGYSRSFPEIPGVAEVRDALGRLSESSMDLKRQILTACGEVVIHDGQVTHAEAQLIRVIADALDCPVPVLPRVRS